MTDLENLIVEMVAKSDPKIPVVETVLDVVVALTAGPGWVRVVLCSFDRPDWLQTEIVVYNPRRGITHIVTPAMGGVFDIERVKTMSVLLDVSAEIARALDNICPS